ncbi:hydroxymethylbilane synthase [bacterium]|nr:MAG: hydroxymethylbilane synthase [bacterium]MCL4231585.1 hydroxymethylbilane synthase [Dehalococcoidia bacterium]
MTALRLGTRGSRLARVQSEQVASLLRAAHPGIEVRLVEVVTAGDRDQATPLSDGTGWFTTAIQEALLSGDVDFAVHSYKDLPTAHPEGLVIAAVPAREDPRDALVSRDGAPLAELRQGAVIGTSSPRREAQVLALRPGLQLRPIRGNVDTRVAKVDTGEFDAAVLALAGLRRLGLESRISHIFTLDEILPAPAQGALAVECRADDARTRALLSAIHDHSVAACVTAERCFLAALEAGCSFPAAAHAELGGTTLSIRAMVARDGAIARAHLSGPSETAGELGRALAASLVSAT